MKKISSIIALLLFIAQLGQSQNDIKQQADNAYKANNYSEAAAQYEKILQQGIESHEVYYNLGCAYYRMDEIGKAIVNFERANRIKRNDKETQENLALAYSRTSDQIKEVPQLFIAQWWDSLTQWLSPSTWYGVLLIMILLLAVAIVWFMLSCDVTVRRITLIASVIILVFTIITSACAISSSSQANSRKEAIIIMPHVSIKSAPQSDGIERFALHEGTKVVIEEYVDQWYHIRIADGNSGWIEASKIEII